MLDATDEAGDERYQFIGADVFEWIKDNTAQYDVILLIRPRFLILKSFKVPLMCKGIMWHYKYKRTNLTPAFLGPRKRVLFVRY